MSKVTVSRIPDIDRYAGGVKNIAKTYKSTLTTANQQLVIKSEGQQADAVNKYLEKLNILQSQIFTHFPQEIGNFGTKVKNYADDLTGLGFQINVWSLDGDSGADGVASKLKGEQSTAVETVSQGFQSVLNKATDLLDENRINLTDDTTKTKQGLEDAAKQRTTMDSSIQSSYKVFKSSMQHYETLFMSFEKVIVNAKALTTLSVDKVLSMIHQNQLKASDMKILDAVQDTGDAAVVEAIYASGDKFKSLGSIDATNVSEAMSMVIFKEVTEKALQPEGSLTDLETFLNEVSFQDKPKAKIYMEKLTKAGDKIGLLMIGKGLEEQPKFPENPTEENLLRYSQDWKNSQAKLQTINNQLNRTAAVTSLFEALYAFEIGRTHYGYGEHHHFETNTFKKGSLKFTNDNQMEFAMEKKFDLLPGKITTINTYHYAEEGGVNNDKALQNLQNLKVERDKALLNFVTDVAKSAAVFAPTPLSVGIAVATDLVRLSSSKNLSTTVRTATNFKDLIENKNIKNSAGFGGNTLRALYDYVETSQKLNSKERETLDGLNGTLFETGGNSAVVDGKVINARYAPAFDLQSAMEMKDIEESGYRAHFFRQKMGDHLYGSTEEIKKAIGHGKPDGAEEYLNTYIDKMKASGAGGQLSSDVRQLFEGGGERDFKIVNTLKDSSNPRGLTQITAKDYWQGIQKATQQKDLITYFGQDPSTFLESLHGDYNKLLGNVPPAQATGN